MSSITTRHIRHDWPEWVDWNNQKTVKTMCGVRSRPGLCGIPGITEQNAVVEKNGRKVWGWCMHCVRATFPYYLPPALTADVTSPAILDLHEAAREAIKSQYLAYLRDKMRRALECNAPSTAKLLKQQIEEITNTP